ncbi:2-hydroxychromene-2-carboxylate isomerase [Pseudahrensia aquimaris]|uniref:2-hydroxychromene-2-carboxylate isomerase n=1 Tax=Pseudahrensia aquimaris TaxID=744461 RepID=A0ABW3FJ11_9HYPH
MEIDYYFIGMSPFVYLGHQAIVDVAAKHGAKLNYKPVDLMGVWAVSGAVPPAQRPEVRQRYRLLELQRVADIRGLPLNLKPAHFPTNIALADQCVIALLQTGEDPTAYMASVFAGVWAEEKDMSDESVIAAKLTGAGFDADAIITAAKSEDVAAIRTRNTKEAIAADVVGAPAYVLNGEVFWGQDRIEYLDHALTTGRAPYTAG